MGPFNEGAATDFNTGIGLMIEALLQSPSFIFRTELGPPDAVGSDAATTLTPYETASQLSFLFRDSIPDQPLLQAAADGSLATDKGISQQVDRLLKLPEVQGNLNRIVGEWFNIRQVFSTTKADTYFAALPPDQAYQPDIQGDLYYSAQLAINDSAVDRLAPPHRPHHVAEGLRQPAPGHAVRLPVHRRSRHVRGGDPARRQLARRPSDPPRRAVGALRIRPTRRSSSAGASCTTT